MVKALKTFQSKNFRGSVWNNPTGFTLQLTKFTKRKGKGQLDGIEFKIYEAYNIKVILDEMIRYIFYVRGGKSNGKL